MNETACAETTVLTYNVQLRRNMYLLIFNIEYDEDIQQGNICL